jgi:hypothetical protein
LCVNDYLDDSKEGNTALRTAREIKGKNNINNISHSVTENKSHWFPSNLMEVIKNILSSTPNEMEIPKFKFEMTRKAALENWKVLDSFDLNLEKALENQRNSQLGYGSEFRKKDILQPLLEHHPLWSRFSSQLETGADFPLEELEPELKKKDLEEALEYGNHKGADNNKDLFESMIKDDVLFFKALLQIWVFGEVN